MKKIIDILAIVLPLLILLLPLIRRIFLGKTKSNTTQPWLIRFLRTFFLIMLLLIGVIQYSFFKDGGSHDSGPKPVPLAVSKHSAEFNESLQRILDAYYDMTDAFATSDTSAIGNAARNLKTTFDHFDYDELKKDSTIYLTALDPINNSKTEVESIIVDPSIDEKRGSLNILSDNLRSLLVIVKYDLAKVYWQECEEAFGEDKPGNWLSRTVDTKNPYPLKDNKACGAPRDTLNYMVADSTKN